MAWHGMVTEAQASEAALQADVRSRWTSPNPVASIGRDQAWSSSARSPARPAGRTGAVTIVYLVLAHAPDDLDPAVPLRWSPVDAVPPGPDRRLVERNWRGWPVL
jgi:hypothetical protein